ncbi:MAG TPA: type II toxin-antitoxin system VapC family toxin [Armatimonadota bacterium]|jgi:hypothetical protein
METSESAGKPSVYVETTIISYLAASPSRDLVVAAHQQITHEWWNHQRERYDLFISQLVVDEASGGDAEAAERRLALLSDVPRLPLLPESLALAHEIIRAGLVPPKYATDAAHVALAAVHRMSYVLTWNCTHMANAAVKRRMEEFLRQAGFDPPILCTPEEMPEG